jgi:hypothetical protein
VIRTAGNAEIRLPQSNIQSVQPSSRSIMPDGFEQALPPQQLQDLLAYLQSLK